MEHDANTITLTIDATLARTLTNAQWDVLAELGATGERVVVTSSPGRTLFVRIPGTPLVWTVTPRGAVHRC